MKENRLFFSFMLASILPLSAMATIVDGERQRPTYETQGFVAGEEVYMLNVGSGQFFTQGNSWATQASVGAEPRLVKFLPNGAYDYTMLCYSWRGSNDPGGYFAEGWRNVFFDSETALFVDRASQANYFFAVEENGGTFRIATSANNPTYADYAGAGLYVGLPKSGNTTALSPFVDEAEAYVDWAIVTKDSYNGLADAIAIYEKAQELKVWIDRIEAVGGNASSLSSVYLNEEATKDELQAAIDGALSIYIQAAIDNAADKENVDVTLLLANPEYEDGTNGWTVERASGGNVAVAGLPTNKCFEAFNNSNFDIYQTVNGAPVGVYEIEVQGFYRYLRDAAAWNAYKAQEVDYVKPEGVPVYVYLNNNATPFKNIYSEPVPKGTLYTTDTSLLYPAALQPCEDDMGNWYPNEMYNSAIAFNAGMYKQSAYGLIANAGDLFRIGVKGKSNQGGDSWVIWDNFKLYYRGFKAEVVKPVLETAVADLQQYSTLLMGKSEYASLSTAFAAAQTAIDANDGEAMFQVLNTLYDLKEAVIVSKDLFLEQEVPADTVRLAEAIAAMEGKKLSKATLLSAQTLLTDIKSNAKYEGTEISQLKSDVTAAIEALSNSVAIYASLNEAVVAVEAVVGEKAYQALIDETSELLIPAKAGYEDGSLTDPQAQAQTTALNEKLSALNASIAAYVTLKEAIDRLEAAISEVGETATKSALKKANLRLTASKKLYDEGTIADADIAARVQSIDELIEELTASVRLRQQYDAAIASLDAAVAAAQDNVADAMLRNAQALQTAVKADYDEGSVADSDLPNEIARIENIVAALEAAPAAYQTAEQKLQEIAAAETTIEEALATIAEAEADATRVELTEEYSEHIAAIIAAGRQAIEQLKADNAALQMHIQQLVDSLNDVQLAGGAAPVNSIKGKLEAINANAIARSAASQASDTKAKVEQAIAEYIATDIRSFRYVADDNEWYDLNGRKLSGKPTRKGLYICNGRRVSVK